MPKNGFSILQTHDLYSLQVMSSPPHSQLVTHNCSWSFEDEDRFAEDEDEKVQMPLSGVEDSPMVKAGPDAFVCNLVL